ncbi:MAG TPA: hypothetical protein VH601_11330 [Bryobacteraceae bacterium]|jgi:hypothetical protein
MKVKVILGGEAVNIPKTNLGLGVAIIRVWVDGKGFTSASNSLGALGYILLETSDQDIGPVDADRQRTFRNLHGSIVHWTIKSNVFVKDGGIADITMAVPVEQDGNVQERLIRFVATNCRGVALTSNALDFSCEMLQEADPALASATEDFLSEDELTAAVDAIPPDQVPA